MSKIASILKSNSHQEYIGQIINPITDDIPFDQINLGSFVIIEPHIMGIICNTEIINPNALVFSEQKEEIAIYTPDLKDETDIYLKIFIIGYQDQNSQNFIQSLPANIIRAGSAISLASDHNIRDFHQGKNNQLQITYLPQLLQEYANLNPSLFMIIKNKLQNLLADQNFKILEIIEKDLVWNKSLNI